MDLASRISIDPNVRFGKPCVRGTRITVGDVLSYLASGMTEAEVLADFPSLSHEDVLGPPTFIRNSGFQPMQFLKILCGYGRAMVQQTLKS